MKNQYVKIFRNFHSATELNIYILNSNNDTIERYTTPLAANLSKDSIKNYSLTKDLNLYLVNNHGSLGIFQLDNYKVVGWNPNFTIGGKGGYLRKAVIVDHNQFSNLMSCLYFMIFQKWPELNIKNDKSFFIGENIDSTPANQANYEGYLSERELMDAVTDGNLDRFNKHFVVFTQKGNFGKFGQSISRDAKDIAIAATTLYTRAAIAGGVYASEAYGLSDQIIKQIEQDGTTLNYYEYSRAIGEIFINRVIRSKRMNLTSPVYKAQEYIYANYRTIKNIDEIARTVGISSSYLQHIFKKETGKSLIQFINGEKVKQTKHDLIFTEKSIEEIAYDLGYSNQGQLSTLFKKATGKTPIAFRKQYK